MGLSRVQSSQFERHLSGAMFSCRRARLGLFLGGESDRVGGLVGLVRLAGRCGLATLIRWHVDLGVSTGANPAGKAMGLTSWPTPSEYRDWSVEQFPVALGDDSHLAVDDGDGGLVVDGVARQVKRGGPALRVG
jgi:hypothetical protein